MHSSSNLVRTNSSNRILAKLLQNPIIRSSWAQHQSLAQGRLSVIIAPSHPTPLMQPQSLCAKSGERSHPPTPPHPTPCERSIKHRVKGRGNVVEGTLTSHPTPCERSSSILRKVEGMWPKERYNIPTPPPCDRSINILRKVDGSGRRNVNIPTPPLPHPMWA